MTPSTKPEVIKVPSEEDLAMATGNLYRKFGEIWTHDFQDMRAERQTNKQTDTVITVLCPSRVQSTYPHYM